MPMVSSKLGIGAIQGGVAVGFWLLDPVESADVSLISYRSKNTFQTAQGVYPFLWAFLL